VSKNYQKPLLSAKFFFVEKGQYDVNKNPECYADFRSEEIIQKKCTDKK
jgi:hypothetical protein